MISPTASPTAAAPHTLQEKLSKAVSPAVKAR